MLTEERYQYILEKLERESVIYLNDLVKDLNTSESTIRRDLNSLDKKGLLNKVHGGATSIKRNIGNTKDHHVDIRKNLKIEEKIKIAKRAAKLIENDDFIYLDSGTTTDLIIDFIEAKNITVVTNGINHAKKSMNRNFTTYILGGELKIITEAIIGIEAINSLSKYNFTKGFFGTNGIDISQGYTTPDLREALVKTEALRRCKKAYVLADSLKFDEISSITFSDIDKASIITTSLENSNYKEITEVMEVD